MFESKHPSIGDDCIRSSALPLGMSLGLRNVDQDDVAQFGRRTPVSRGGADVSGPDDADLRPSHNSNSPSFTNL